MRTGRESDRQRTSRCCRDVTLGRVSRPVCTLPHTGEKQGSGLRDVGDEPSANIYGTDIASEFPKSIDIAMPYNRLQASAFLAKPEIELFESSLADGGKSLATATLHRKIQRTRSLRDKHRDLLQWQKLATQARTGTKNGVSGQANERTKQKSVALDEALKRFENEAARREAQTGEKAVPDAVRSEARAADTAAAAEQATPPAPVPAPVALRTALDLKQTRDQERVEAATPKRSTKAPAIAPGRPGEGSALPPSGAEAAATASRFADSNLAHTQGHTSTQVRRSQAKRDHRS